MRPRCAVVFTAFAALALAGVPAQNGTADRISNPAQFTSDSDFLQKSAEDFAFLESVSAWTKDHGTPAARKEARILLFEQSEFGASLEKLADNRQMHAPLKMNEIDSTNRSRMDGMVAPDVDHFFVKQESDRYRDLIERFRTEAQQGRDSAIRKWASDAIKTLQQQQQSLERLKSRLG